MANDFYTVSGAPSTSSAGSSSTMRAEFAAIAAAFDKAPGLSGNGSKAVIVNSGATALTVTTGTLALAGNFATSGASALTLTTTGATNVTLPTTGTVATLAGSESLSNKTLVTPILGTPASGTLTNCTGYPAAQIVATGALNSGSITSGFGSIDVGGDSISGGALAGTTLTLSSTAFLTAGQNLVWGADYNPGVAGDLITATGGVLSVYLAGTPRFSILSTGIAVGAGQTISLDGLIGTGDTYLRETSANVLDLVAGGTTTLRLTAIAAAVTGTLSVSGALTTNGGLQTFGAADSGGAGYRMVRVPN